MKNIIKNITDSAKELKKPTSLVVTALMIAFGVILHTFGTISISEALMLKWAFIPMAVVGMMYGAIPAALCGGLIDLISTLMMPKASGGFFVGITFCMMASGFLYGLFLYKTEKLTMRIILCTVLNFVVVTMLLTTAVLSFSFGSTFMAVLLPRFIKAVFMPIEAIMLIILLKALKKRLKNLHL